MLPPKLREEFPILSTYTYLDSACMALKPKAVINAVTEYYTSFPVCEGRSHHRLGEMVSTRMEGVRKSAASFWRMKPEEVVFTKNATESINLVAKSFGLTSKDTILTTDKEHNSNLLPWLQTGAKHDVVLSKDDAFDFESFMKKVKTARLVAMAHTSNLDGTSIPLKEIIKEAHKYDVPVLVDAAQSAPHQDINMKKLDIDFMAVSGHKMLGPTGVGFLVAKKERFEKLQPFMTGGGTAIESWYDKVDYAPGPSRFEAGLQNYAGIIGMQAAFDFLNKVSMDAIEKHDTELNTYLTSKMQSSKIERFGPKDASARSSVFAFNIKGLDSHTVAIMLSEHNILVRSGAHCVQSWFNANKQQGNVRASMYLYNNKEDIDKFVDTVKKIEKLA